MEKRKVLIKEEGGEEISVHEGVGYGREWRRMRGSQF
jgi:hypothetical protein